MISAPDLPEAVTRALEDYFGGEATIIDVNV
jgi:hypothetical protein